MRLVRVIPVALILCGPWPLFAQGWVEYASPADFFSVNLPGEPSVEDIVYTSEYEAELPARVHTWDDGASRYSVTVVDYTDAERIHTVRAGNCPPDAHTGCSGASSTGVGSWIVDVRGAMDYATWQLLQRDGPADVLRLELRGPRRGPSPPTHPCRPLPDVRGDLHARGPAVRPRSHRATAPAGPRAVPAVVAVPRRRRQPHPLRARLRQRLSATSPNQMMTSNISPSADIAHGHRPQRWVSPTMSGISACAALLFCLVVLSLPGGAHHSHGNYELADFTHLEGTVQEVHLLNPHSWIFLDVPGEGDGGEPTLWAMEGRHPRDAPRERHRARRRPARRPHPGSLPPAQGWLGRVPARVCGLRCTGIRNGDTGIEKEWD